MMLFRSQLGPDRQARQDTAGDSGCNAVNRRLQINARLSRVLLYIAWAQCELCCFCCAGSTPLAILLLESRNIRHITVPPAQVCAFV